MSDRYLRNLHFDFPSDLREQFGIVQLLALVDSNIAAKQAARARGANLEEEEAIAKRLSELDDLIVAKRAKITALQRLKKSLMQNLLTGRMRLSPEAIAKPTAEKAR